MRTDRCIYIYIKDRGRGEGWVDERKLKIFQIFILIILFSKQLIKQKIIIKKKVIITHLQIALEIFHKRKINIFNSLHNYFFLFKEISYYSIN